VKSQDSGDSLALFSWRKYLRLMVPVQTDRESLRRQLPFGAQSPGL